MPTTIYNDGSLYGDTDAFYGRLSPELLAAQLQRVRETGLKVSITDERLNQWEYVAGSEIYRNSFYYPVATGIELNAYDQEYWFRRGQAAMVKLSNGNIYRIRLGTDSDSTDRQIWEQTITDPLVASQWTSWSVKYSGEHFAIAMYANGATPVIYHAKIGGVYRDNVLETALLNVVYLSEVQGQMHALFATVVSQDLDGDHDLDLYYTPNVTTTGFTVDSTNFRWRRNWIQAYKLANGKVARVHTAPWYVDPRLVTGRTDSLTYSEMPSYTDNTPSPPQLIRGLSGINGQNNISTPVKLAYLDDGYFYIFHREIPASVTGDALSNLNTVWQRSKDLKNWSAPTASGFNLIWPCGVVSHSGYYWIAGNGAVYRRVNTSITYDLSNFVPEVNFEIPRANQPGNGTAVVANPNGINDVILTLADRRMRIEVGMKVATGQYEFVDLNWWWLERPRRVIDAEANRLELQFGDIWSRLTTQLRDTYNWIGQTQWSDWAKDKRNKSFNYYFLSDVTDVKVKEATANTLTTEGICLWTAWRGTNGEFEAHFSGVTGNPRLIFRYLDTNNYMYADQSGSSVRLYQKLAGVDTQLASAGTTGDTSPTIKVSFVWSKIQVWVNDVLEITHTLTDPVIQNPGYIGFYATNYKITNFIFTEWEAPITSESLIRAALALGDFHDVIISGGDYPQVSITWGPQTDLPTAAEALQSILEGNKLELIWRNNSIEVGQFKDKSIVRVIENEVIESEEEDEASTRINLATVDGNEHTWIEVDVADTKSRGRQIVAYFDLPELTTQDAVTARAKEEIRRSKLGQSPGGTIPLLMDLWRMDAVTWIDNSGESKDVRIEGMQVSIRQGESPEQKQTIDTSLLDDL